MDTDTALTMAGTMAIPGMAVGIIGMATIGITVAIMTVGRAVDGVMKADGAVVMNGMAVVITDGMAAAGIHSPTADSAAGTITADLTRASNFTHNGVI